MIFIICLQDQDKLAKFFSNTYKKDMLEKELSVKGWNWGRADFNGSTLSFAVGSHPAFEIPLSNVSQCTTGKNEVTLEFHQVKELFFKFKGYQTNVCDCRMMMHQ